eukprot:TRINITY_DN27193_c0_g1_i1.p1 TRINITY_DN27193_c0_g1~~TRINITY_DN27193_c0_g1_i1.p1  ORF type:complete len:491 (+),score=23.50 TRINITY_DN27193_c0_g1_i1:624-2096(+)
MSESDEGRAAWGNSISRGVVTTLGIITIGLLLVIMALLTDTTQVSKSASTLWLRAFLPERSSCKQKGSLPGLPPLQETSSLSQALASSIEDTAGEKLSQNSLLPNTTGFLFCNAPGGSSGLLNGFMSVLHGMALARRWNRTFLAPIVFNAHAGSSGHPFMDWGDGDPDPVHLGRMPTRIIWDIELWGEDFRRWTKYFYSTEPTIGFLDLADVKYPRQDANIASFDLSYLKNNGPLWCFDGPPDDTWLMQNLEAHYPPRLLAHESVVCSFSQLMNLRISPLPLPPVRITPFVEELVYKALGALGLHSQNEHETKHAWMDEGESKWPSYVAIHLRRGDWCPGPGGPRGVAVATFDLNDVKQSPFPNVHCPDDEYVIKIGLLLQQRLSAQREGEAQGSKVPLLLVSDEGNEEILTRYRNNGFIPTRDVVNNMEELPRYVRPFIDVGILTKSSMMVGQYGSTFSLAALLLRGCDGERPSFPCGAWFGDEDLLKE